MAFLPPASYPNSAYLREDSIKWALQKATAVRGGVILGCQMSWLSSWAGRRACPREDRLRECHHR